MKSHFQGIFEESSRIIYTASGFAKSNLLYLQEVGELQALKPHTSSREALISFLFFTVTDGTGLLTYNDQIYHLVAGDCVFIDCRKAYSQTSDTENLWHLKWAHFYGANMNGIYEKYIERGGGPVFTPENSSSFSELLTSILNIAGSEDYIRDMKINEKLASLLTLIMAESWHPEKSIHLNSKKQSLSHVKAYLEEHYQEKITLEQLSAKFYINKFYLSRIFKSQFGITVLAYLEQIRITHAKQLLRFSNLTVEEIGQQIGFDEPGYFSRVFKKIEGITPGEYRKRW